MNYQDLINYIVEDFKNDWHYKDNASDFDTFNEYLKWAYENSKDFTEDVKYIINNCNNENSIDSWIITDDGKELIKNGEEVYKMNSIYRAVRKG